MQQFSTRKFDSGNMFVVSYLRLVGLIVLMEGSCAEEYKIGMIVQKECCHWSAMYRIGGAMILAMDQLKEDHVIIDDVDFR